MMTIPEGFTEAEVLDAINRAINSLASNFSFGYYDEDDMKQEGFIFACEALPRFDPNNERGCGLENFLRIHIRNRFLNLRRDKLHRNSPPCLNCPFRNEHGCAEFEDKSECPKWSGWNSRNQAKRSLVESCDATRVTYVTQSEDNDVCSRLSRTELLQRVSEQIPLALRADYRRLIEGARLSKPRREAVVEAVRSIIGESIDGQTETWQD